MIYEDKDTDDEEGEDQMKQWKQMKKMQTNQRMKQLIVSINLKILTWAIEDFLKTEPGFWFWRLFGWLDV